MTVTVSTVATVASAARYLMGLIERHQNGDMTDEELQAAWDALQIKRAATKDLWEDAKAAGGYE